MTYLALWSNSLEGPLPSELELLTGLQELSLYSNSFSGAVPSSFCNFNNSIYLQLDSNPGLICLPCLTNPPYADLTKDSTLTAVCSSSPTATPTTTAKPTPRESDVQGRYNSLLTAHDQGKLPQPKQRAACYVGATPGYKHRRSLLDLLLTGSAEALEKFRQSLSRRSAAASAGPAASSGRESLGLYATNAKGQEQRDIEMRGVPRISSLDRGDRPSLRLTLGTIDDIPNPMMQLAGQRSADPVMDGSGGGTGSEAVSEAWALSRSGAAGERRNSVRAALEGVLSKRLQS